MLLTETSRRIYKMAFQGKKTASVADGGMIKLKNN